MACGISLGCDSFASSKIRSRDEKNLAQAHPSGIYLGLMFSVTETLNFTY
jgi:hypothetical protein